MVGWMLRGNAMCALLVAGRSWASGMPEGHLCNAGLQSSGACRPKDKVKKSSTSALSQEAPSQVWRAWKDMGEADQHSAGLTSLLPNQNQ